MKELILNGCSELGLDISQKTADALIKYYKILIERNKSVNLTRITDPDEVVTKHFLDSLTTCLTGCVGKNVIDVGTGAGFPGLVLKCATPSTRLTLLDSLNKRISFLQDAAEEMGIRDGIEFMHSRAEDAGLDKNHREKYDTAVSRAVANMRTLSEWCLPLVRTGGYFLALKGPLAEEELTDALPAIEVLGGEVEGIFTAKIPYTDLQHKIIIVKKVRHTPTQFPRKGKKATEIPVEKVYKKK
ncbi:MAG: 16S rRNA (guanine(527)-N(7))-methyltransferase RsmG [Clostridia bacterium]|nr:16S rRNA (guanine(527)-N(7))-methyltransferase RsmG [Clostridia bacterium]